MKAIQKILVCRSAGNRFAILFVTILLGLILVPKANRIARAAQDDKKKTVG